MTEQDKDLLTPNSTCESCADAFISTHEAATNKVRELTYKEIGEWLFKHRQAGSDYEYTIYPAEIKALKSGKPPTQEVAHD